MLAPALPGAIRTLATLTGKAPAVLTRALPASAPDTCQPRPGHNRLPQMPRHPRHLRPRTGPAAGPSPDLLPPRPVAQRRQAPARPHPIARDRHCLPAQPQAPPALHTPAADDRPPGCRTDPARTRPARWRAPADPPVTALAAPAAPAQGRQPAPGRPPRRGTRPRSDLPRRPRTSRSRDRRPAELSKDTFKQDPLANSRARHPATGHPPRRPAATSATKDSSRQVSTHPARKIICHRTFTASTRLDF